MRFLFVLTVLVGLTSCASTTEEFVFDGSTEQSIQEDIKFMLKKLPNRKKLEFSIALIAIQFSDVKSVYDMIGDPAMESMNYHILSKKLDGLTYKQVIKLAQNSPTKISVDILTP